MREIVHIQAGQCGNQIGAKVKLKMAKNFEKFQFFSLSFGKLYLMSIQLTQLDVIAVILICNWNVLM